MLSREDKQRRYKARLVQHCSASALEDLILPWVWRLQKKEISLDDFLDIVLSLYGANLTGHLQFLNQILPPDLRIYVLGLYSTSRVLVATCSTNGSIISLTEPHAPLSIRDTQTLRNTLISPSYWPTLSALPRPLVFGVMELIQLELDSPKHDPVYQARCFRTLKRLAKLHGALPPSYYVQGIKQESPNPVSGGGFADVYMGYIGTQAVALKVLRFFTGHEVNSNLMKDLCHEAIVWRQLNHPNIIPFLGINVDQFQPSLCLVSPFMENGNVINFLRVHPTHDRLKAIIEIAEGLEYLHMLDPPVIHGDLRGANILINRFHQCVLADFGLSTVLIRSDTPGSGSCCSNLTAASSLPGPGAVRWMAPEVLLPGEIADPSPLARDVYAFGCTMYEILTLNPPFHHHQFSISVALDVQAGGRPSRPDTIAHDEAWDLIESCWVHSPQDRLDISSVTVVLHDMRRNGISLTL